jgi:superfamily II DNA/RNA helicase
MTTFHDFNLLPSLQLTLDEEGFRTPTEIQELTLPHLLSGKSAVGLSETGSGKTLAYVLPVLQQIKTLELEGDAVQEEGRPRAVVVVPTRELGEQVSKVFKTFTHTTRLRVRSVLGGTTMKMAKRTVSGSFEVLVATPSRLHQLVEHGLRLTDVRIVVFDEADQMLDPGFIDAATRLVTACPPRPQMILFSATISKVVDGLIRNLFSDVEVYKSSGSHRVASTLTTHNLKVVNGERFPLLLDWLARKNQGEILMFTNTKKQCDVLAELLEGQGIPCAVFRGGMDRQERRKNLKRFTEKDVDLLISTDLGSRGLDFDRLSCVMNYHLPQEIENYLHRVGRTARAGRGGMVVNFVTERDKPLMDKISRL